MAIFKSFLLGDVRKSVANLTMYAGAKGTSIARGKRMNVYNPRTLKQQMQRAKMSCLVRESLLFSPALDLGFPTREAGTTPYNAFVHYNIDSVTVDDKMVASIDYTKLVLSAGSLVPISVTAAIDAENNALVFTQKGSTRYSVAMQETDMGYAVVFEKMLKEIDIVPLKARKEGGNTTYTPSEGWKMENVMVYVFTLSKNGGKSSRTTVLTLE